MAVLYCRCRMVLDLFLRLCALNNWVCVCVHISKDSGLTMGMAAGCWCVNGQRWSSQGGLGSSCLTHSSCALLPTAGRLIYCNTWPRVSGNFVARKLPAASAPAANMMGTALVMPTNDWKMLMPRTAASLQRALRKPNAVVLNTRTEGGGSEAGDEQLINGNSTWIWMKMKLLC